VFEAVRENLPEGITLEPGVVLEPGGAAGRFQLRVVALTERGAMLDGNHPLAGKDLDVEVEVLAVD
jgi:FKBP-type peptidyl-prolyl cis-trans isomerase 2